MLLLEHYAIHVGVLCCFALFVCLILLASFFLPSHLSFMYNIMIVYSNCKAFASLCAATVEAE